MPAIQQVEVFNNITNPKVVCAMYLPLYFGIAYLVSHLSHVLTAHSCLYILVVPEKRNWVFSFHSCVFKA
jgi:hypothetical protein